MWRRAAEDRRIAVQSTNPAAAQMSVAFIADSRISQTRANNESFANLRANLNDNGIAMSEIGTVVVTREVCGF